MPEQRFLLDRAAVPAYCCCFLLNHRVGAFRADAPFTFSEAVSRWIYSGTTTGTASLPWSQGLYPGSYKIPRNCRADRLDSWYIPGGRHIGKFRLPSLVWACTPFPRDGSHSILFTRNKSCPSRAMQGTGCFLQSFSLLLYTKIMPEWQVEIRLFRTKGQGFRCSFNRLGITSLFSIRFSTSTAR